MDFDARLLEPGMEAFAAECDPATAERDVLASEAGIGTSIPADVRGFLFPGADYRGGIWRPLSTPTPIGDHGVSRRRAIRGEISRRAIFFVTLAACLFPFHGNSASSDENLHFFESQIRPLLATRCISCHGGGRSESALRLDSREAILRGSNAGPVVTTGDNPDESRLILAAKGELPVPASCKLKTAETTMLAHWIRLGLPWSGGRRPLEGAAKNHWAFQPAGNPAIPAVVNPERVLTEIDPFVLAKLEEAGLNLSPEADRRTLIRRVSYGLTGLPPSPEEVTRFVEDPDPQAYEKLVDRLLDSPHHGEHWARHWLDVARYSDTKGYVYAREERFWPHAWAYRDWVVRSLNDDLPYNRFLLLQIAADQVDDRKEDDLAAMGFLTLGRRFLGVNHDIIDDRIDVVTRGTMGLTVICARCHDHMYDPIPTADYYSLYGVFDSSAERLVALGDGTAGGEEFQKELATRLETLETETIASHRESSDRVRERLADYLKAQTELNKYPPAGFDQIFGKDDILPAFVRRWNDYLVRAKQRRDPVFMHWHAYAELPAGSFADDAARVTAQLGGAEAATVNPIVARAFETPPESFGEVIARYAGVFNEIDSIAKAALEGADSDAPSKLADPAAEALRGVLYGRDAPCEVPDQPIVHTETYFDSETCTKLWKLQGEVDRWIITSKAEAPFALTLVDRPDPVTPRIFLRGNPVTKGEEVPRRFLELVSGEKRGPFQGGSGRFEMAHAIINPSNPLTARVMVNRVWAHHFGTGLVATPSDFGTRAGLPSHPELLDHLASRFVAGGWSLKKLHRWIVLSATFRQSSQGPAGSALLARALEKDPANRLLWRMNQRRLSFEELRDSMLAASRDLDLRVGGKPVDLFKAPHSKRRTLYGRVDRQFLPGTLRVFDFANPDLHIPKRPETTVSQQALFFLNDPLVLERSRATAARAGAVTRPVERVRALFQLALQRDPTTIEATESLALIAAVKKTSVPEAPPTAEDWKYGYGFFDEGAERVTGFTPLPHFTGEAWQGGPKWPDEKLGWVQLTAAGGHPGNDREHAAVRRWTAPRSMTIVIKSRLIHERPPGDGVRAFIVNSRAGKLISTKIHHETADLDAPPIEVEKGETIDFVVDIDKVLNSDEYLWSATLSEADAVERAVTWNSERDFSAESVIPLTAWELLAQTLICSNEFLFVD